MTGTNNNNNNNNNVNNALIQLNPLVEKGIGGLSNEELQKLQNDLSTNKSIYDILKDLTDMSYDQDSELTPAQELAIIEESIPNKLDIATSELSEASQDLDGLKDTNIFNHENDNVEYLVGGEYRLDGNDTHTLTPTVIKEYINRDTNQFTDKAVGLVFKQGGVHGGFITYTVEKDPETDQIIVIQDFSKLEVQEGTDADSAYEVNYYKNSIVTSRLDWSEAYQEYSDGYSIVSVNQQAREYLMREEDSLARNTITIFVGEASSGQFQQTAALCNKMPISNPIQVKKTLMVGPGASLVVKDMILKDTTIIVMGNTKFTEDITKIGNIHSAMKVFMDENHQYFDEDDQISQVCFSDSDAKAREGRIQFHNASVSNQDGNVVEFVNVHSSEINVTGNSLVDVNTYGGIIENPIPGLNTTPQLVRERIPNGYYPVQLTGIDKIMMNYFIHVHGDTLKWIDPNKSDYTYTWDPDKKLYRFGEMDLDDKGRIVIQQDPWANIFRFTNNDTHISRQDPYWVNTTFPFLSFGDKLVAPATIPNTPEGAIILGNLVVNPADVITVTSADGTSTKKVYYGPSQGDGTPSLVTGEIIVPNNVEINVIELPKLKKIGGNLSIATTDKLTTLAMNQLEHVEGNIILDGFTNLENLDMSKLKTVDNLTVKNTKLSTLNLKSLISITGGGLTIIPGSDITNESPMTIIIKQTLVDSIDGDYGNIQDNKNKMKFQKIDGTSQNPLALINSDFSEFASEGGKVTDNAIGRHFKMAKFDQNGVKYWPYDYGADLVTLEVTNSGDIIWTEWDQADENGHRSKWYTTTYTWGTKTTGYYDGAHPDAHDDYKDRELYGNGGGYTDPDNYDLFFRLVGPDNNKTLHMTTTVLLNVPGFPNYDPSKPDVIHPMYSLPNTPSEGIITDIPGIDQSAHVPLELLDDSEVPTDGLSASAIRRIKIRRGDKKGRTTSVRHQVKVKRGGRK
jgi:hypothetical protein